MNVINNRRWSTLFGLSAVVALGVAGCTDSNNNGQPDGVSQPAVDKAVATTENAVSEGVATATDVGENGVITGKIKSAYIANASLKASTINVTTMSDKKTVMLEGSVQNAAQKNLASTIAKQNAPGYKIDNKLAVAGGASPKMNPKPAAKTSS